MEKKGEGELNCISIPGHIGLISENHPGMMVEMLARPVPGLMFSISNLFASYCYEEEEEEEEESDGDGDGLPLLVLPMTGRENETWRE